MISFFFHLMQSVTFCLCIMLRRSPKGDSSGLSNARRARVRSISVRHSRLSSPCSASCVCANSSAASVSRRRISSIRCCCCGRKADNLYFLLSNTFPLVCMADSQKNVNIVCKWSEYIKVNGDYTK